MELTTSKKIYYEENKDRIRAREKNRILNMTQEELKNYRELSMQEKGGFIKIT